MNKVKNNFYPFGEFPEERDILPVSGLEFVFTGAALIVNRFGAAIPGGATVNVDWGDGTDNNYGVGTTYFNKNWGAGGVYNITLTGDYALFQQFFGGRGMATFVFDVAQLSAMTVASQFHFESSGAYGDVSSLFGIAVDRIKANGSDVSSYSTSQVVKTTLDQVEINSTNIAAQADIDRVIHDFFTNLVSRPGAGLLKMDTTVAPSATGVTEAAAIATHGWTVTHD